MAASGLFAKRDTSNISYTAVRPLIKWTYVWMFIGLVITSVIAAFGQYQFVAPFEDIGFSHSSITGGVRVRIW